MSGLLSAAGCCCHRFASVALGCCTGGVVIHCHQAVRVWAGGNAEDVCREDLRLDVLLQTLALEKCPCAALTAVQMFQTRRNATGFE